MVSVCDQEGTHEPLCFFDLRFTPHSSARCWTFLHIRQLLLFNIQDRVYGLVVMIAAFQAAERGSIPRARMKIDRVVSFLPLGGASVLSPMVNSLRCDTHNIP